MAAKASAITPILANLSDSDKAALLALLSGGTPAPSAPAEKAPKKAAGPAAGPFAGKGVAEMQDALTADPKVLPLVKAELQARVERAGKSAKSASAALARLAEGGPLVAPKGEKGSWAEKTPAELVAEATAKMTDHTAKLVGEQAEVAALEATLSQVPDSAKGAIQGLLESARKRVARRQEYIRIQAENIRKNGGTVPGTGAPRKARTPRTQTAAA